MEESIAIIVPVYNRPHRVQPLIDSVRANTTVPYSLLFVCSPGDKQEIRTIEEAGGQYILLDRPIGPGDYAKKINLGYRSTTEPFIFTGADDLQFHPGWDVRALEPAVGDARIGVVGTNDLGNPKVLKGEHSTHSLVQRAYADQYGTIDRRGAIYCEEYPHEFVDDELVQTAKYRGAWAFAAGSIVEHLHPHWGKAPVDHLYRREASRIHIGRRVFNSRKHLWASPGSEGVADISVIVATYGDLAWKAKAAEALESVYSQSCEAKEVIDVHGSDLATARNEGAAKASAHWLCFLDADDELAPGYLAAMRKGTGSSAALLNPAVKFITPDDPDPEPKLFRTKSLNQGNYMVIGTVTRKDLFNRAGGFDPQWEAWEDWALFWRIWHLRPRILRVPKAVYCAYWNENGRNNTVPDKEGLKQRIQEDFQQWRRMMRR